MRGTAGCVLLALGLIVAPAFANAASAQSTTVTAADIQRLQDDVSDLDRQISRIRGAVDAERVSQLQGELDDLRDDVVYLRVKQRREGTVSLDEYTEVRDRLEKLRARVASDRSGSATPSTGSSSTGRTDDETRSTTGSRGSGVIPVGQEIDTRLQDSLSSDRNQVEDRFTATTLVDLEVDRGVVIPAGSELRGVVSSVNPAGRIERKGSLTVSFDQITIDGRTYPMRGTVTQALESEGVRGEVGKIGAGAGVGAIIGGILGGVKGALAGILIGGGGVIAATEGKDVELPAGTILRVRLDAPPDIRYTSRSSSQH
jgi:hypothetical protein